LKELIHTSSSYILLSKLYMCITLFFSIYISNAILWMTSYLAKEMVGSYEQAHKTVRKHCRGPWTHQLIVPHLRYHQELAKPARVNLQTTKLLYVLNEWKNQNDWRIHGFSVFPTHAGRIFMYTVLIQVQMHVFTYIYTRPL
jgi:hypothetical protein